MPPGEPVPPREAVLTALRGWLAAKKPGLSPSSIGEDTDIIEGRILDSMQLIEFVLFIEEQANRSILSEQMDMNALRTLSSVYARFFEAGS